MDVDIYIKKVRFFSLHALIFNHSTLQILFTLLTLVLAFLPSCTRDWLEPVLASQHGRKSSGRRFCFKQSCFYILRCLSLRTPRWVAAVWSGWLVWIVDGIKKLNLFEKVKNTAVQRCFTNKLSIESTLRRRWRVLEYKIDKPAVRRWWRKNILTISMLLLFLFDVSQRRSHFKFPKWVEESLTEEVENVFFALISIRGTEWDKWKLETRLRPACLLNWVPLGDSRKRMTMRLETLNCYQMKAKEEENEYTKENLAEKIEKIIIY